MKVTFEDKSDLIDDELQKRRSKWQLKARNDLDFDDVKQIIRLHIWKKWKQWDQKRKLEPWLNRVITNQIRNLLRNNYSAFVRPCLQCPANEGNGLCSIYTQQSSECPLYAKWERTKKRAYDVKMPLPLEYHNDELQNKSYHVDVDYSSHVAFIHKEMKKRLTHHQYQIYSMLFIENLPEKDVAKKMNYRGASHSRKSERFKQLENHKKTFVEIASNIIQEYGLYDR